MKRSKLRNTFNKERSSENWQNYKRQRNICSNILKSTKKTFFETLNINEITDNRKFWKTVKPFFTDKSKTSKNIVLTEKNKTLNSNKKISNTFNEYFTNIIQGLNLRESTGNINVENEESCKKIKENFGNENFSFETVSKKDILDLIKELPGNKATGSNDMPVSVLKESVFGYYEKLIDIFNNCIRSGTIPEILKKAEVTSTQQALLKMIEALKTKLNMGHKVGVIYMDLSKAFDSLNHELLIAKLKCYGLDQHAVEFFRRYLSNRYQCCKTNNTLGDWKKIIAGVPQGSILDPLLFNILFNDIFSFLNDANLGTYADDSTLYAYNKKFESRKVSLHVVWR